MKHLVSIQTEFSKIAIQQFTLNADSVIKVEGIPLQLKNDTDVLGTEDNIEIIKHAKKTKAPIIPLEVGDTILMGKWKNKKVIVKSFGTDKNNQPTVNGKPLLNFRIQKLMDKK